MCITLPEPAAPSCGRPVGTDTALGPQIWEMVHQVVGLNKPRIEAWKACPSEIPRSSFPGPWPLCRGCLHQVLHLETRLLEAVVVGEVQRGFDASQTFLRYEAVTTPAIIFPWIRARRSTQPFAFGLHQNTAGVRERWTMPRIPPIGSGSCSTSSGHFLRASRSGFYQFALTNSPLNYSTCPGFASGTRSSNSNWQCWNSVAFPAPTMDVRMAGRGWNFGQLDQRLEE